MHEGAHQSGMFDWTLSPAKWGAVGLLAMLGAGGLAWSVIRGEGGAADVTVGHGGPSARAVPLAALDEARSEEHEESRAGVVNQAMAAGQSDGVVPELIAFGPVFEEEAAPPVLRLSGEPTEASSPLAVATPARGEVPPPKPPPAVGQRIDLNHATEAELQVLPGIGPARARAIIEDRRIHGAFRSVDDLERVRGIGPAILEGLRGFAVAG